MKNKKYFLPIFYSAIFLLFSFVFLMPTMVKADYAATPNYSCQSGWTLSGSTCTLTTVPIIDATCSGGFYLDYNSSQNSWRYSTWVCYSNGQEEVNYNITPQYTCSSGTLSDPSCSDVTGFNLAQMAYCHSISCIQTKPATISSYFCPSGGTLSGTMCITDNGCAAITCTPATAVPASAGQCWNNSAWVDGTKNCESLDCSATCTTDVCWNGTLFVPGTKDCSVPSSCNNNGTCDAGETTANCPADCPAAPVCDNDGTCEAGETTANCLADCPAVVTKKLTVVAGLNTKVTSVDGIINCNAGAGVCSKRYNQGTTVKLVGVSTSAAMFTFGGASNWTGCDSVDASNRCVVKLTTVNRTVNAAATCNEAVDLTCGGSASTTCTNASCLDSCGYFHPGTMPCSSGSVQSGKWTEVTP